MKPALLFISHRIPYPPNKGDKIRSYHLLRYLSGHFRIFLATFIDDENDWQYTATVRSLCEDACFVRLDPGSARLRSLRGLLTGEALSVPYYANRQLGEWVNTQVETHGIQRVIVYSSAMAQYVMTFPGRFTRKVIDFVDVDSDKWQQYAKKKSLPMSWIYRREGDRLLEYDRGMAALFDASLFVCSAEAALFRKLAPGAREKIGFYNNGVDTGYFSPEHDLPNPYPGGCKALVFTGAMDYWPNVDAVIWFAQKILPLIRMEAPQVTFYIVGSNPKEPVQQLHTLDGVVVTGRVDDVRPYIRHALAAVAPMRIARGIQNKVLEAMAMSRPVVVSPQGLEGIDAVNEREVLRADTEQDYVRYTQALMNGEYSELGKAARARVQSDFNWEHILPTVKALLETDSSNL